MWTVFPLECSLLDPVQPEGFLFLLFYFLSKKSKAKHLMCKYNNSVSFLQLGAVDHHLKSLD